MFLQSNLIEFFEETIGCVDEGSAVNVVNKDFSKAFNKLSHGRLIKKIKAHGIHSNLASWIQNWLSGSKQRVVVEDCL